MSLVSDYTGFIRPRIDRAISEAMYAWVEPFKGTIDTVSGELNGSSSRPMLFGHGVYEDTIGSNFVIITNITPMQGTDYGIAEVVFVEEGMSNYHMPGPRPFMEKAGQEFAGGEGEHILQAYLDTVT